MDVKKIIEAFMCVEVYKNQYGKEVMAIPYYLNDGTKVVVKKRIEDGYEVNKIYKNDDEDFERISDKTFIVGEVHINEKH